MKKDFVNALTSLPITRKEDAKELKFHDSIKKYDDPAKAAKKIPKTHSGAGDKSIYWAERSGKTRFEHHIFRTGEREWTYVQVMDFLD